MGLTHVVELRGPCSAVLEVVEDKQPLVRPHQDDCLVQLADTQDLCTHQSLTLICEVVDCVFEVVRLEWFADHRRERYALLIVIGRSI